MFLTIGSWSKHVISQELDLICVFGASISLLWKDCKLELQSEISGSTDLVPSSLGKGFDSLTQTLKGKCVSGTPVWAGAPESEISYVHDLDFDTLLVNFNGGINVEAKISLFDIKGAGEFASKNAADDFSSTFSLINNINLKKKVLDETRIDESMRASIFKNGTLNPDVRMLCGDEYVSTIAYGANLIVNAKFTFQSREDKKDFNTSVSFGLFDLGSLGGKLGKLDSRLKNNSRVTISARQVGGDPEKLAGILASEIISCNLASFEEKCLPMLTRLIEYAKDPENGFRSGLASSPEADAKETPKGWAQLRYITTAFADEPLEGQFLISPNASTVIPEEIRDARDEVYNLNRDSLRDYERASLLIKGYTLTEAQHAELEALQAAVSSNKIDLASLTKTCLKKPDQCLSELSRYKTRAAKYDSAILLIKPLPLPAPVVKEEKPERDGLFWKWFGGGSSSANTASCSYHSDWDPAPYVCD